MTVLPADEPMRPAEGEDVGRLLEELVRAGVKVSCVDGQLRLSAPKHALTAGLLARIRDRKAEIVRRLAGADIAERDALARLAADPRSDFVPFPLSDLQLGFYLANDPYMEFHVRPHLYLEFDLEDLDVPAYVAAWNKALQRHRRSICVVNRDIELELVRDPADIGCTVYDLRDLPAAGAGARLSAVRAAMERSELPLDTWPWLDLRVSLWQAEGRSRARVHYNHNNFFGDGFGTMQLLAEIDAYYRDAGASFPPFELSYRDAVLGLERVADSDPGRAAREYWFSRLPGLPPPPNLPQKPGVARRCRSCLERREGTLAKAQWEALKLHASRAGLTPSNVVTAAYAYVLATWSNTDRFILSQMMTRRSAALHPDLLRMFGNFVSLYPLEIDLDSARPFVENARRIQTRVLEDMKHLQIGGMRVLQELNRLNGSFGAAPSSFVIGSGLGVPNFRRASYTVLETSQTLLDHQFFELAGGSYYYVWDLMEAFFPDGMIDDMWQAFESLLHLLAADADAWSRTRFPLIGDRDLRERQRRNATAAPAPQGRLHDALPGHASRRGTHPVLFDGDGALSYAALDRRSAAVAAALAERGVGRHALVPIVMDRTREAMTAVLGVLRRGAAYVPIDPRVPAERLAMLLAEIGSGVALTERRYVHALSWPDAVAPAVVAGGELDGVDASAVAGGPPAGDPSDLAYVIYTSGSTGRPKGVMIDHRGALNTVLDVNRRFGVGPGDRVFGVSALNFDLSVYDIFGPLAAGASLVYPHPDAALDPAHWLELLIEHGVTIWNSVPALLSLLVEAAARRHLRLPSLRLVMLSGDKIPLVLPDAVRELAPHASVVSLGGATEASIWSILYPIGEIDPSWSTIPYGYPLANQQWEVRDRNGAPCPAWVPGELEIGGLGVALGYWNDPEKTRRSFRIDPAGGTRVYRTGDLGRYVAGGCIEWMGRLDTQVKLQGHRIEPGEIEAALLEHHAVRDAAVVLQVHPATGQPRLLGCVVAAADAPVTSAELEHFLQCRLPAHMVPPAWRFLERLPLTGNGKVDRKTLSLARPDEEVRHTPRRRVPPADGVERRLAAIWARVLNVTDPGATDDFFESGGQSFDAIRLFALIKEEFGRGFGLTDIWRARTIRELARLIGEAAAGAASDRIVAIGGQGSGAPLFLVHPAGGSVVAYSRLGRLIGRPLHGIQAGDGIADVRARRDIESLARLYVSDVRKRQPFGPYSLGGWSTGAVIAFEMAAQLEHAGEAVDLVACLDGPTPVAHADVSDARLLAWFVDDLALGAPLERVRGAPVAGLSPALQLRLAGALLAGEGADTVNLEELCPNYEVFRDLVVAASKYRPPTIAADVLVVRVEEDVVDEFADHPHRDDEDWGWRRFSTGQVRCVRVPGTHHSFLREPLVDRWGALLTATQVRTG